MHLINCIFLKTQNIVFQWRDCRSVVVIQRSCAYDLFFISTSLFCWDIDLIEMILARRRPFNWASSIMYNCQRDAFATPVSKWEITIREMNGSFPQCLMQQKQTILLENWFKKRLCHFSSNWNWACGILLLFFYFDSSFSLFVTRYYVMQMQGWNSNWFRSELFKSENRWNICL